MSTIACRVCGLRNGPGRDRCLRCGEALGVPRTAAGLPSGVPAALDTADVWREGDLLVAAKGASLPDRCVRCDAPSGRSRLQQKYYWHSPALYLIAPFALLIYAIIAMAVRKSAHLEIGLCVAHLKKRTQSIVGGSVLALLGFAMVIMAIAMSRAELGLLALAFFLAGGVWGTLGASPLKVKHIDDRFVRLKGANLSYLQRLPQFGAFS